MHARGECPREAIVKTKIFMATGLCAMLAAAGVTWIALSDPGSAAASPTAEPHTSTATTATPRRGDRGSAIQPLWAFDGLDPRIVDIGRRLFHDPRLSGDQTLSCASCHDLASGGDDGRSVSVGIDGGRTAVNAPTVLNSGHNFMQFWDGRAKTLEEQVDGPLQHPNEMGADWDTVLDRLNSDSPLRDEITSILGGTEITRDHVRRTIADFERSLVTLDAPFDRFLRGEDLLTDEATAGWELFQTLGCTSCHQGTNIGGNLFQRFGVMGDYFADRGNVTEADYGRYNVTGRERDRFRFKVPSLRNIELTAPYFHDGSARTLEDAVRTMARYQLGRELDTSETSRLVAFLESLTGTLPEVTP